jgi:hypothetical protein
MSARKRRRRAGPRRTADYGAVEGRKSACSIGRIAKQKTRWVLPDQGTIEVNRHGRRGFVVDHYYGDGGWQSDPYSSLESAREAALELIAQIAPDFDGGAS